MTAWAGHVAPTSGTGMAPLPPRAVLARVARKRPAISISPETFRYAWYSPMALLARKSELGVPAAGKTARCRGSSRVR